MNLVKELKNQTEELKNKFIEEMVIFAKNEFSKISELFDLDEFQLGQTLGFESYMRTENVCPIMFPNGIKEFNYINGIPFCGHVQSKKLDELKRKVNRAKKIGIEGFITNEIDSAKKHYDSSIVKLAQRIERKGLDLNNIKMETSFIDVNIETTITDGVKFVTAHTIVASGQIQRPHYRYLIK